LALTYDDGPGRTITPQLLDLLAARGAHATFLPTARSAANDVAGIAAVRAAGHEFGCHSAWHSHAWKTTPWRSIADVHRGLDGLAPWLPPHPLYRPPYGKLNLAGWLALRARGARLAWWTIDSGDTHAVLPETQTVVERVYRAGGGVVLMHDFDRDPPHTAVRAAFVLELSRLLLEAAAREGWRVRTLGQILEECT